VINLTRTVFLPLSSSDFFRSHWPP